MKRPLLLAQLWSYNPDTKELTNKNGPWQYQNYTWEELPSIGIPGLIKESSGNVLSIDDYPVMNGVVLEPADGPNGEGSKFQLWTLGITYKDGSFTLRNPTNGGYLTATSENSTGAEGNITSTIYSLL